MINTHSRIQRGVATLFVSVFASVALAGTLTLSTNAYSNGNGLGGGEFTATSATLSNSSYSPLVQFGSNGFATFCLEYGEHFSSGSSYTYTLSNAATGGSGGAMGGSDPISKGTAWLYSQFATGALAGYSYGAGRQASNNALQLALWFFEDETALISGYGSYGFGSGNVFLDAAVNHFGGDVSATKANATVGAYGVSALNLTTGSTQNQSQLYYAYSPTTPNDDPGTPGVPDSGTTAALLGLSLIGLAGFKRRMISK